MSSRPFASTSRAGRTWANPNRGPPGMTTSGAPSPIRRYASSVPAAVTVPARVEAVDTGDEDYFSRAQLAEAHGTVRLRTLAHTKDLSPANPRLWNRAAMS